MLVSTNNDDLVVMMDRTVVTVGWQTASRINIAIEPNPPISCRLLLLFGEHLSRLARNKPAALTGWSNQPGGMVEDAVRQVDLETFDFQPAIIRAGLAYGKWAGGGWPR